MISCDNLSEKEKKAQKYMEQIATNTNSMLKLPAKVDDFTFAEKVKFDKKTNTIIYSYVINKSDYGSETEIKNIFKQIENEQFERAKENQGEDQNYETLSVTIKSVYKNKKKEILYSFDIKPNDYLKTELEKSEKIKNETNVKLFSKETFEISLKKGIAYQFEEQYNKETDKLDYSTKYSIPTTTFNLKTDVKNPFGEIIEKTEISIEIILEYKAGIIKFKSKQYRDFISVSDELKYFDVSDFFKDKSTSLDELQGYADYFDEMSKNVLEEKDNQKDRLILREKYMHRYYSTKDLERLRQTLNQFGNYFDNSKQYNYFTDVLNGKFSPSIMNTKGLFCLRLFKDFEQIEDKNSIKQIPTINKFMVENAHINIYLTASNTNGFSFNNKIKTINIKDKWNNHFINNNNDEK